MLKCLKKFPSCFCFHFIHFYLFCNVRQKKRNKPEIYPLEGKGLLHFTMLYNALQHFTLVMHHLPDSLQCPSFKIPKPYYISQLKSDILVLHKCKSQCKVCFTGVNPALQV